MSLPMRQNILFKKKKNCISCSARLSYWEQIKAIVCISIGLKSIENLEIHALPTSPSCCMAKIDYV